MICSNFHKGLFRATAAGAMAGAVALAACSGPPGEISRDTRAFDRIAEDATIMLTGNEPFWNLKISPAADEGYRALYKTPERIDGIAFSMSRFAGNNGLGFNGEMAGRDVQVSLSPGNCSDGMTDRTYPYHATVAVGDRTLLGCGYTDSEPFEGESMP